MPVQINEMQIKAHIAETAEKGAKPHPEPESGTQDKEEIIKECTDFIIEWLSRKNER